MYFILLLLIKVMFYLDFGKRAVVMLEKVPTPGATTITRATGNL